MQVMMQRAKETTPTGSRPKLNWSYVPIALVVCFLIACNPTSQAQQKGQWQPGQFGLNAGSIPSPGITYANMPLSYSASQLNNSRGNAIPGVAGTYSVWVDENIAYYVPKQKILGGYFMPYIDSNWASGQLVADFTGTDLSTGGGGSGLADTFVEPLNLGWHFGKRVDFNAGYAFTAPTGRFTPGASNNVGSGYRS